MLDVLEQESAFRLLSAEDFNAIADVEMLPNLPPNFSEVQVIRRVIQSVAGTASYTMIDEPTPRLHGNYTTIENLVRQVATGTYVPNPPDDPEAKPLGIRVTYPSYIVLQIDPNTNWTFSDTFPAVMLQAPVQVPNLYGKLGYVRPDGTISYARIPGCKVVFFAAMPTFGTVLNPYVQKTNYYVTDAGQTGQVIDPDIRHPGIGNS